MSTPEIIEGMFPYVPWTGGSHIHRSFADAKPIGEYSEIAMGMRMMVHGKVALHIWARMQEYFGAGEWLVSEEDFVALFTQDMWGWLNDQGSSTSENMLKNPKTGNVFHRVALYNNNLVGGIRFWIQSKRWGYRFRIEYMETNGEKKTRAKTAQSVLDAHVVKEKVYAEIELTEPKAPTGKKVRAKILLD